MSTDLPQTEAERMYASSMMQMMQAQIEQAENGGAVDASELKSKEDAEYDHMMEYYMAKMNRQQRRAFKANLRKLEKQEARDARAKR